MSLSYRLPLHWLRGTVQNIFDMFLPKKIVPLYSRLVNRFGAIFRIFYRLRLQGGDKSLYTLGVPARWRLSAAREGRRSSSQFRFQCSDEQVAGDHAVFGCKAVFEVCRVEELGVRGEFVVALPDDQAQAVFVQKAEFIRRVAML